MRPPGGLHVSMVENQQIEEKWNLYVSTFLNYICHAIHSNSSAIYASSLSSVSFTSISYFSSSTLSCVVLYCMTLHYIALYWRPDCIVLRCIVGPECIVLYCVVVLYCIASHRIASYCIALYCIVSSWYPWSAPGGPHAGHMNHAIWDVNSLPEPCAPPANKSQQRVE